MATKGEQLLWAANGLYEIGTVSGTSVLIPLSSGTIEFYEIDTTTPKTVHSDVDLSASLGSTVTLDANGKKTIFTSGTYYALIKDSDTNTISTITNANAQRNTFADDVTFNGTATFGSSFGFSDGTVGGPGIQFSSDTNTGIRRIGADNLAIVAGGADILDIDGTGIELKQPLEATAGSAASPSITFATDLDSGVYRSAANQVSISAGGAQVLEVTGTGVILDQPLLVQDGSAGAPSISNEGDTDTGFLFSAADTIQASAGGSEQMEVTSSGVNFVNGIDPGDNGVYYKTKIIAIGDWNLDSTTSVTVAHGLTAANIRAIRGYIRNDANDTYYPLTQGDAGTDTNEAQISSWDSTNITLARRSGGLYDNADFDSTSYDRGHLVITYV